MQFGRYTIQSELGRGGMATVFLAYDNHRRHTVALKVLPRTFLHDPTFRERFEREARLIMQLEHDAIVPVYDYGEIDGQPYIAMRLMRGGSLKDRLQAGALSPAEADAIMRRIGSALDKAHARSIVHRDLKPGNILFDDEGLAYLADFGIARLVEGTQTVTLIGTPQYMAPEQAHGLPIDARTDVYQMGVVLFEMLTGRVPFDAPTPAAMLYQHAHTPAPPVRDFNAALPEAIMSVVQQALAKDKTQRFQNMKALFTAFSAARHGVVPPSPQDVTWIEPPPPPPPPPPATASRDRDGGVPLWATVVGVLALLLIIGGSIYVVREWLDRRGQPPIIAEQDSLVDPPPSATSPAAAVSPTAQPTVEVTPTPRPSATQEPTATPVPTDTPQPTPTWTPLPTATPTWTPIPPPTATPQPTPCAIAVAGTFSSLWQADLGCATGGAGGTFMAMEDFERGRMIWRQDNDRIYAIYDSGSWASYADIWREGDPEYSCGTQQSPPTPRRGFGKIWCTQSSVQNGLGAAVNGEWGADGTVQPFANGVILRAGDGRTYVLLGDGRWR